MSAGSDQSLNHHDTNSLALAAALEAEIESQQLYLNETMPDDFAFTIHNVDDDYDPWMFGSYRRRDREGEIFLTKEFDGEKIKVTPYFSQSNYSYRIGCGRGRGRGGGKDRDADSLNLHVEIAKKYGRKSSFHVYEAAGNVTVEAVNVTVPSDEEYSYFSDSDSDPEEYIVDKKSNMQDALREYLKTRGIEKSSAEFLHNYMLRKSKFKNQPVVVLKKVLKFLED